MTEMRASLAFVLLLAACRRDHHGERDRKHADEEDEAEEAEKVEKAPARDQTVVETAKVSLTWTGTITESKGKAPSVSTPCTLQTRVRSTSNDTVNHDQMTVTCGGKTLYDESASMKGDSHTEWTMTESPVAGDVSVYAYTLKASDVGTRTGDRNQMTVSTKDRELIVYRDNAPTFRVKIDVAPRTDARRGKPLFEEDAPPFPSVSRSTLTLTTSSGKLPFEGKSCELVISPGWTKFNCTVQMTCAGKIAFGADGSGHEKCTLAGGKPVAFSDTEPTSKDADPELTLDSHAHTATLADVNSDGSTYSATFTTQ